MLKFVNGWMKRLARQVKAPLAIRLGRQVSTPAVFHVTHWKAGSQWIFAILRKCCGLRVISPEQFNGHFVDRPLQAGCIYPTCYVTHEQFMQAKLPAHHKHFVIIRDLRDTVISHYFSAKVSHAVINPGMANKRTVLNSMDQEEGLLYTVRHLTWKSAEIQQTWLAAGEPLIKYEDLLERDEEILVPLLTEQCPLGVPADQVRQAVIACRFENLARGRKRGEEDIQSHQRKGIAGDWQNYFTDRVKEEFKAQYGQLLIATGYEKDLNW